MKWLYKENIYNDFHRVKHIAQSAF
jgi:hypothetical protein